MWRKCPSRLFFNILCRVFERLFNNLLNHDDREHGETRYENHLKQFSREHLEYLLIRNYIKSRAGANPIDKAIVWLTPKWRQTSRLGQAMKITFMETTQMGAATAALPAGNVDPTLQANVLQENVVHMAPVDMAAVAKLDAALLSYTTDGFWAVVNSDTNRGNPRFSSVMFYKTIIHNILKNNVASRATRVSYYSSAKYFHDMELPGRRSPTFWDNKEKLTSYIKGGFFKKKRGQLNNTDLKFVQSMYDNPLLDNGDYRILEWEIALGGMSVEDLVTASRGELRDHVSQFKLFDEYTHQEEERINVILTNGTLAQAVNVAAKTGIITSMLLTRLLHFREIWQQNRKSHGRIFHDNGRDPPLQCTINQAHAQDSGFVYITETKNTRRGRG
jgi:hypothetical protein